eukprot:GEMP01067397.1.p1 GENE.GEMP01067397.1~~GEMP01067397.1.p1  ORF type:complete len:251 (+),score=31.54 GEMP01067397.1:33-755(+)
MPQSPSRGDKGTTTSARKRSETPVRVAAVDSKGDTGVETEIDDSTETPTARRSFFRAWNVHWSMLATWVTLLSTIVFNVQFNWIYKNMQQGPLFNTLLTEYSDPQILDALDIVDDFARQRNTPGNDLQYAYDFIVLKHQNDPIGREIDHARRRLISCTDYMDVIPGRTRAEFFMNLVEPLDAFSRQMDHRPMHSIFDYFRRQYNLAGRNTTLDWSRLPASMRTKHTCDSVGSKSTCEREH